tara:strand:- start:11380 stop:12060 length:681 start_codon:yes stop_codon:yes gene_type:complete
MSLLDRLIPAGFQSNVAATFSPKAYALTAEEFLPKWGEGVDPYARFKEIRDMGYEPTQSFADILMSEEDDTDMSLESIVSIMENPENSEYFVNKSAASGINPFSSQSLAEGFKLAGVTGYDPSMATTAKLSSLRALDTSSYAGQIAEQRGSLADTLVSRRQTAQSAGGGFAGYGGRAAGQEAAELAFESGVQDIYGNVGEQRSAAMQNLYGQLDDYSKLISQQQGG